MASVNSRKSSASPADTSISSLNDGAPVDERYACYWLNTCRGEHEIDHCATRRADLRGKLGIYYSPNNIYKRFRKDGINDLSLEENPTGCMMIQLLIYKIEENQVWLLFITRYVKDKNRSEQQEAQPLLTLPSAHPHTKNERPEVMAKRAMGTITNINELTDHLRPQLKRFLFVDASVIYPLQLTKDRADLLEKHFQPTTQVESLRWIRLDWIRDNFPQWDYLKTPVQNNELAQVREGAPLVAYREGAREHAIWSGDGVLFNVHTRSCGNGNFSTIMIKE